jgi:hypothetical protein
VLFVATSPTHPQRPSIFHSYLYDLSLLFGVLVNENPSQIQTGTATGKFRLCQIPQANLNFMLASVASAGGRAHQQTVRYSQ